MNIIFTNTSFFEEINPPVPAEKNIPEWYKQTNSYVGADKKPNGQGATTATIKRCMPVFDAITSGYIIESPADIYVSIEEYEAKDPETKELIEDIPNKKVQVFEWANFSLISFHPVEQALLHPAKNEHNYPKWTNPWAIKTPIGYSTLFIQPMHRDLPFTILPGIVDTDKYFAPVNFPFTINDPNFQGLIPKGTPIAQVIPFKRDIWEMSLGNEQDVKNSISVITKLHTTFFDKYKNMFRQDKVYK